MWRAWANQNRWVQPLGTSSGEINGGVGNAVGKAPSPLRAPVGKALGKSKGCGYCAPAFGLRRGYFVWGIQWVLPWERQQQVDFTIYF